MHPKIRKFWEDAGYQIEPTQYGSNGDIWYWARKLPHPNEWFGIAKAFSIGPMEYFMPPGDEATYTEEQMLRLIQLKAFW